ncbi:MAG TPA: helix-turn-helix domain-containing protein [Stackebrandtia sp.]|uniref:helix-turn-helix domain-containing protein n=1 Tax=Stackebrandtia sp. TaxID=2023065 RepID=UPI002D5779AA|nr:helix-turn-helix domain-containing protein [Stackebrandtia sp.]HZE37788.1 helix-turn-helix domain-containing protein [Stackebrandtia sp.]
MYVHRAPRSPILAPFVEAIWYVDQPPSSGRERVLPNATAALIVNLARDQIHSFDGGRERRFGGAIVHGATSRPTLIDASETHHVIGATFRPGGSVPFLPVPGGELRDGLIGLDDLWRREGAVLRERLLEADGAAARVGLFEDLLAARALGTATDPAVTYAVAALSRGLPVAAVTDRLGLLPGRFARRFGDRVGVTPKLYARLLRFQRTLRALNRPHSQLARVAADQGFYDQAHMAHEFRTFSGASPSAYRPVSPDAHNHVRD